MAIFALFGLATSLVLIPRDYETAMLEIAAGDIEHAVQRLERMHLLGDRSPSVAAALAFARADLGNVEAAIDGLEEIAADRPQDTSILETLAALYRGNGRLEELAGVLARQQAVSPTGLRQIEIAEIHEMLGDVAAEREALWTLVSDFEAAPEHHVHLARIEASAGRLDEAKAALDRLRRRSHMPLDISALTLSITIDVALGEDESALATAREWLRATGGTDGSIKALADAFQTQDRPDLIVELFEPITPTASLTLLEALGDAYYRVGRVDEVETLFALMQERGGEGALGAHSRLRLAYAADAPRRLLEAAREMGTDAIPAAMRRSVASAAILLGDGSFLRALLDTTGDRFLRNDPLFAAKTFLALREYEAAELWMEEAYRSLGDEPVTYVTAAEVDFELGRRSRSFRSLKSAFDLLSETGTLSQEALLAASTLFVGLEASQEGEQLLDAYRQRHPSRGAELAWALTAAAAGKAGDVLEWKKAAAGEGPLPAPFLDALAQQALRSGAPRLAASAASALVEARGSDADKMLMATAFISASWPVPGPPAVAR